VRLDEWFLTPAERANPATRLDSRHPDGLAWSVGNDVHPLVHGATYFAELLARVRAMGAGDLLLFTDWRGDPDERLDGPDTAVASVFCAAASRGVVVRGLLWRSHLDRFQFSEQENRSLGDDIEAAGGCCLLDMRVRPGGSHHMKIVVLRHPSRPERDVAFVGGIDLCHSRRDDSAHEGDPQRQPMAAIYSSRPPWHDLQALIRGPAVGDVETIFRERWEDPAPLTRNPVHRLRDLATGEDHRPKPLPPQLPDPQPCGTHAVQFLRTYPYRRSGYSFAPDGERSIARAYLKVLPRARSLIYLEDQYLWSTEVVSVLADALRANPGLHLIVVIPRFPDQDGKVSTPPNLVARADALALLDAAGGRRVAVYGLENSAGTPIYVHAKVCIVDDTWAIIGSDNFNRRSWTHDSEASCAIIDESGLFASRLRLALGTEHLGGEHLGGGTTGMDESTVSADGAAAAGTGGAAGTAGAETAGGPVGTASTVGTAGAPGIAAIIDPADAASGDAIEAAASFAGMFEAFGRAADALDAWHAGGRKGPRPAGQLRRYPHLQIPAATRAWASVLYRLVYDPDGRPAAMRRANRF
jgi:phosphatidylserine/phosphatidylglycerophosphate/cardiolipin synthase-like enzyme